jgi:hypothetical protein
LARRPQRSQETLVEHEQDRKVTVGGKRRIAMTERLGGQPDSVWGPVGDHVDRTRRDIE